MWIQYIFMMIGLHAVDILLFHIIPPYENVMPLSSNHHRWSSAARGFAFGKASRVAAMSGIRRVRSSAVLVAADATSAGGSPGASPKSVVGSYDLDTLPNSWDNCSEIRERMRNGQNLVLAVDHAAGQLASCYVDATVENLKANVEVLIPVVTIMQQHELQLPGIEKLISAVDGLFTLAKVSRTNDHFYQEAWAIRRLISKLKRFTYRTTPPQELQLQIRSWWCSWIEKQILQ